MMLEKIQKNFWLSKGFSVTELIIVCGILALLVTMVFTTFVSVKKEQAINKDSEAFVEILRQARNQTLSSQNSSQYGVHIASNSLTLFTGTTYSAGNTTNIIYPVSSSAVSLTASLNGGGSDIVFNRLTGETSQYGTINVTSPTKTIVITIYKTGLTETN